MAKIVVVIVVRDLSSARALFGVEIGCIKLGCWLLVSNFRASHLDYSAGHFLAQMYSLSGTTETGFNSDYTTMVATKAFVNSAAVFAVGFAAGFAVGFAADSVVGFAAVGY